MREVATQRGFTLLELLVTMGIVLIVLTAAYQSYTRLLGDYVVESASSEAQMETIVNTNLLRLDIAHAGYGIQRDTSNDRPIAWDNSSKRLTIRSTIDNLDEETLGWILCHNGNRVQDNNDSSLDTYVFLDQDKLYESHGGSNCPASGIFIGYPYDSGSDAATDGCADQACYSIIYELSGTQNLDACAEGTRNLQRSASVPVTGGTNWDPVINCVADWQVAFELDTTDDGTLDTFSTDIRPGSGSGLSLSVSELYDQVEQVHVYALVQEGNYDRDFQFSGDRTIDGITLDNSGVSEFSHYRWKTMKLSVKPQDM